MPLILLRIRACWVLFFNILPCLAFSQVDTIFITDCPENDIAITNKLKWSSDSSSTLTPEAIGLDSTLYPMAITKDTLTMPLNQVLWYKGCLCNQTSDTVQRYIYARWVAEMQVWQNSEGELFGPTVCGDYVNKNECSVPEYGRHAEVLLAPRQCTEIIGKWKALDRYFLKYSIEGFHVSLRTEYGMKASRLFISEGTSRFRWKMIFFGITCFLSLFMLFHYIHSKDKVHLYYSLYTASLVVDFIFRRSHDFHIPFRYIAEWTFVLEPYITLLPVLSLVLFFRVLFFSTTDTYSKEYAYKATNWILYLVGIIWIVFPLLYLIFPVDVAVKVFALSRFLFIPPSLLVLFWLFTQSGKDRFARYFTIGLFLILLGVLLMLVLDVLGLSFGYNRDNFKLANIEISQITILLESAIFGLLLGYRNAVLQKRKDDAELKVDITEDRLSRAALKPHLVSKALINIEEELRSGEIEKGSNSIGKLVRLFGEVLRNLKESSWSLASELSFTEKYLALERLRFGEKSPLLIKINKPVNIQYESISTPTMLIQPLVENAINHGLLHLKDRQPALRISISTDEVQSGIIIEIEDNGIGRNAAKSIPKLYKPTSIGLQLTKKRLLSFHSDAELAIEDLTDASGAALGTKVVIYFPQQNTK